MEEAHLAVSSLVCRSVCTNIVFGRGLRRAEAPARSARLLLPLPLPWLHFKGTLGNQRDADKNRDRENPGKLFYIIPRHNRANLSVLTHARKHAEIEREENPTIPCVFLRFRLGAFSGFP